MKLNSNVSQLDSLWQTFKDYSVNSTDDEHSLVTVKALNDTILESNKNVITELELTELDDNKLKLTGKTVAGGESSVIFGKSVYITGVEKYALTQTEADKNIGKVGDLVYRITLSDGSVFYAPIDVYTGKATDSIITEVIGGVISSNLKINNSDKAIEIGTTSSGFYARLKIDNYGNVKLEETENGLSSKLTWIDEETFVGFKTLTWNEYNAMQEKQKGVLYVCSDEGVMYLNDMAYPDVSRFVLKSVYDEKVKQLEDMDDTLSELISLHDEEFNDKIKEETDRAEKKEGELEKKITTNETNISTNTSSITEINKKLETVISKDEESEDVTLKGKLKFSDESHLIEKTDDGLKITSDKIILSSVPSVNNTTLATKQDITDLIGAAPAELDTLKEIAEALQDNDSEIATILSQISTKVSNDDFDSYKEQVKSDIKTATDPLATKDELKQQKESIESEIESKYLKQEEAQTTYQTKAESNTAKGELDKKIEANTTAIETKQDKLNKGSHIEINEETDTISCDIKIEEYLKSTDAEGKYQTKTDADTTKSELEGKVSGLQTNITNHVGNSDIHVPTHSAPNQFLMSATGGKGSQWQTIHLATKDEHGFMSKEYAEQLDLLKQNGLKLTIENITWGELDGKD